MIYVSPGAYTRELDLGQYGAAISSSILAVEGTAIKGPINELTFISSPGQAVGTFGEPRPGMWLVYAMLEFLKRGNKIWANRVCGGSAEAYEDGVEVSPPYTTATRASVDVDDAIGTQPYIDSKSGPFEIIEKSTCTVTGTELETFDIQTGVNDGFKIQVSNEIGVLQTADTLTIPPNIYTADSIAVWLQDNATNSTSYVTFRNNGPYFEVIHNTIGANGKINIQTVANDCYTEVGVTVDDYEGVDGTDFLKVVTVESDGVVTHTEEFILTSGGAVSVSQLIIDLEDSLYFTASESLGKLRITGAYKGVNSSIRVHPNSTCAPIAVFTSTDAVNGTGGSSSVKFWAMYFGSYANYSDASPGIRVKISAGNYTNTFKVQTYTADGRVRETFQNMSKCIPETGKTAVTGGDTTHIVLAATSPIVNDYYDQTTSIKFTTGPLAGQVRTVKGYVGSTRTAEVYPALSVTPDGAKYDIISPNYIESVINADVAAGGSAYIIASDTISNNSIPLVGDYYMYGGEDGAKDVTQADLIGTIDATDSRNKTGLQLFTNPESLDINILYCPGVTCQSVQNEVDTICQNRQDVFGVVDPLRGLSPQKVVYYHNAIGSYANEPAASSWEAYQANPTGTYPFDAATSPRTSLNTSYMGLWWPWLTVYDSYNGQNQWLPPGIFAAAQMAYSDSVSEPWFAPAGLIRGHILSAISTEYPSGPDQGERDLLYGSPNAVNPITNFIGYGITIWGQRTLQRMASATDRVNVRRMMLYARKLVATTTKYLVFEPNDSVTWTRFVGLVRPIFEGIKNRRGLYDFRVVCDSTTNTPDLIDQNVMYGKVVLQPTKAAEIIITELIMTPTGVSFEEYLR